jgi:hypothetical protein
MTNDELVDVIVDVKTRQLVIREFVVWLLAREAAAAPDILVALQKVSELSDVKIDQAGLLDGAEFLMAEQFRQEKDWMILAAQALAVKLKNG